MVREKGSDRDEARSHLIVTLEKEVAGLKKKLNMPGSQHVQSEELAQMEKEKSDFANSLAKEQDERAKMATEMAALRLEKDELQGKWDTHVCATPIPDVSSTTPAQLIKALSDLQVSKKQTHTARQRIQELEAKLEANNKAIATLQEEAKKARKEKHQQEKITRALTNRIKGNTTLLEARRLIWTDIIVEVRQHWKFLALIEEKRTAVRLFRVKLQVGQKDTGAKVATAKKYIAYLNGLDTEELAIQGIEDRFKGVTNIRRVIEKETARVNALNGLGQMVTGLERFDQEWNELVKAGLPSCWEPVTVVFSRLLEYERKLTIVMNQTNVPFEKPTRLKAETIIAAFGRSNRLC